MRYAVLFVCLLSFIPAQVMAQTASFNGNFKNSHFDQQRTRAINQISTVSAELSEEEVSYIRADLTNRMEVLLDEFSGRYGVAERYFHQEVGIFDTVRSKWLGELFEEASQHAGLDELNGRIEEEVSAIVAAGMISAYTNSKARIDSIAYENYIGMLPEEYREAAAEKFGAAIADAKKLDLPTLPEIEQATANASASAKVAAAIAARRLIASNPVVRRVIAGASRRILTRIGATAIAGVVAPIGEWCGLAWWVCEAGLFAGGLAWDGYKAKETAREQATLVFNDMEEKTADLLREKSFHDEIVRAARDEANTAVEDYRLAVEQVMRDQFDGLIIQNTDADFNALARKIPEDQQASVMRDLAATFGDRHLDVAWVDRVGFMSAMGAHARKMVDGYGDGAIALYLERPTIFARLVHSDPSPDLLQVIVKGDAPTEQLLLADSVIQKVGRLDADGQSLLKDIVETGIDLDVAKIEPFAFRTAAEHRAMLATILGQDADFGARLYNDALSGTVAENVLASLSESRQPALLADFLYSHDEQQSFELTRKFTSVDLTTFAQEFGDSVTAENAELTATRVELFHSVGGGEETVLAFDRSVTQFGGQPPSSLTDNLLWIRQNTSIEARHIDKDMLVVANDTAFLPNMLRIPIVSLARFGGWNILLLPIYALAGLFALWVVARASRIARGNSSGSGRIQRGENSPANSEKSADPA